MPYKSRIGEKYPTKEGYEVEIIEYFGAENITVLFNDIRKTIKKNVCFKLIKDGSIKNFYHPSVFNIGYYGNGIFSAKKRENRNYNAWIRILSRCYSKKVMENNPTYIGCTVDERWHNFQVFAEWFENNYTESFDLDKDILQKENKIYSPETCCFVPKEINSLFTKRQNRRGSLPIGVSKTGNSYISRVNNKKPSNYKTLEEAFGAYKIAKEAYIKEVADKWESKITKATYNAMYNYQVEITD